MTTDREAQVLLDATTAGIKSPKELANFMAQVTHESNGLNRLEESFRYTKGISQIPVQSAWRQGEGALESARLQAMQGHPQQLAELMYGGRNGNDQPGDGYTYRGRGYIQLTGKDNYREAGQALGLDLVKHPELAAEPRNASKIAAWYWESHVPEAAREDVKAATKAVNGKYNGLEDRRERFASWEKKLTPEVMERLAKGDVGTIAQPGTQQSHNTSGHASAQGAHGQEGHPESVRKLQADLAALGYTDAQHKTLRADGHFGPASKAALEAFQHDHGLKADGIAGAKTLEAIHQQVMQQEGKKSAGAAATTHQLDHASHPDHALYQQARGAVHRLDSQQQRTSDQHSDHLAASLVVAARRDGLHQIHHVMLSDDASRTFAVQGELNSPIKQMTQVETAVAAKTPIEQSSLAWKQVMQEKPWDPAQASAQARAHESPANQLGAGEMPRTGP
ncbi:XVIPCD domain-containing protein [Dyella silvatica]|uniref:XVIPCD domain-containing protein n=1 Tax=Dyella silvatica TaxID=2992128 RepID=UPI002254E06F|nr:XVIPCD domain-containing protein [Dyella silvatica]